MATESQSGPSDKSEHAYFSFHWNKPMTWHQPRKPQPSNGMARLKLYFRLLFERRKMVKMPAIFTGSFSLFFQSFVACLFYVITLRTTAWYRLSGELVQRHVEATLPKLKETVLTVAHSQKFSAEFVQNHLYFLGGPQSKDDEYDIDEWDLDTPSLDERWKLFYNNKLDGWVFGDNLRWAICGWLSALYYIVRSYPSVPSASVAFFFTCGFNCICTSIAYARRFWHMDRTYQGIEWVQTLSPRPSVGVWWEIELMAMPSVWLAWMYIGFVYMVFSVADQPPKGYSMRILVVLLFFGVFHASYIVLTTKRDNEAIERSWRARINGWVFEQQYVTSVLLEGGDRGLEVDVM